MKAKELVKEKKAAKKGKLQEFQGYLFARLHAIGTKSEGPSYFLQLITGREVLVIKKAHLWEIDPTLHAWLGRKVVITGRKVKREATEAFRAGIDYVKVLNVAEPLELDLKLDLQDDTLWIDKMPHTKPEFPPTSEEVLTGPVSPPPEFPLEMKQLDVFLSVRWPYREPAKSERSIWEGECPTSQFYDFRIEDPRGNTIWQWGNCMLFRNEKTPVRIPGGSARVVRAPWFYFEDSITRQGLYVLSARFIASGQEVRKPFWVKFAW